MLNTKNSLPTWYTNYGKMLTEQAATVAVFSEDDNERLKQYLDSNENLLEEIDKAYQNVADGKIEESYIELDGSKFKVKPGDELSLIIDKTNKKEPVITVSLENDEMLVGDINLTTIAGYVYKSMDGMGTDETMYASALAAIHMDLAQRNISSRGVQRVFNTFNSEAFGTKYEGETLDEWIDGDFDGRAEACAMAIAKRPIPKSIIRGISWGTVFADVGMLILAVPTLGASLAGTSIGRAAIAGGKAVSKVAKTVNKSKKIAKLKAIGKASKAGKVFARVTKPMIKGWKTMSQAAKLKYAKSVMPVGKEIQWISKAGNATTVKITGYVKNSAGKYLVKVQNIGTGGSKSSGGFTAGLETLLSQAGKPGGITMKTATKLATAAGLVGAISKAETGNLEGMAGEDERMDDMFNPYNPAELMGYYDQATANPEQAMAQYKNAAATELASQLHDAMDGWTDNSDELAIALMILSMDKHTASAVLKEYQSMYAGSNFYEDVISGELESDMERIVGCYWAALTGDGPYVSQVKEKLDAAKK